MKTIYSTNTVLKANKSRRSYSSRMYLTVVCLFALMLSSKIAKAGKPDSYRDTNITASPIADDTNITMKDSDKTVSGEPSIVSTKKPDVITSSDNYAIADTLNMIAQQNEVIAESMVNSYFNGINEADTTYTIKKSHQWGMAVMTLVCSPLISAIPLAIASSVSPSTKHLGITDASKLGNEAYINGYKHQSRIIRRQALKEAFSGGTKVWFIVMGFIFL